MLLGAAGCRGNLNTFQPARTMPKGGFQVGVETSGIGALSKSGNELVADVSVAGRYALTDRLEIGARVGTARPELMMKARLDRGGAGDIAISLAPSLGGFVANATGLKAAIFYGQVPLLVGFPFGRHELVLGAAVHAAHAIDARSEVWGTLISPGLSIGFFAAPLAWLSIVPEVSLAYPLVYANPQGAGSGGGVSFQGGLAIAAGK